MTSIPVLDLVRLDSVLKHLEKHNPELNKKILKLLAGDLKDKDKVVAEFLEYDKTIDNNSCQK